MKKIITIILCVVLILVACGVLYVYNILDKIQSNIVTNSPNIEQDDKYKQEDYKIEKIEPKITNVLLFGLDRRQEGEASRSDTIMIATADTKNNKVKLTSLMRDMYVSIPGKGENRINAAYAFGGPYLAIETVNSNFDMDVEDYVTVDFFGLPKIIDRLGGVEIEVKPYEVNILNKHLSGINSLEKDRADSPPISGPGLQVLDGNQTLAYSRIRYVGNSDYERTERQRYVLSQLFKKVKAISIMDIPGLVNDISPYIETSLTKTEMIKLGMAGYSLRHCDVDQYRLPVDDTFTSQSIRGMAVLVPDIEKNKELLHEFIFER